MPTLVPFDPKCPCQINRKCAKGCYGDFCACAPNTGIAAGYAMDLIARERPCKLPHSPATIKLDPLIMKRLTRMGYRVGSVAFLEAHKRHIEEAEEAKRDAAR